MSSVLRALRAAGVAAVVAAAAAIAAPTALAADLSQDFDPDWGPGSMWAPVGWPTSNLSSPGGTQTWFQGNPPYNGGPFSAHQGVESSYIGVNYNSSGAFGTIDNWLMSPLITTLTDGDTVSFYTRTATGAQWPDRLQLLVSTDGTCDAPTSFTRTLLTVNPNLISGRGGYPDTWTKFSATLSGLPAGASGCFALRYWVTNAGPPLPTATTSGSTRSASSRTSSLRTRRS
jgi:hypothetical protein